MKLIELYNNGKPYSWDVLLYALLNFVKGRDKNEGVYFIVQKHNKNELFDRVIYIGYSGDVRKRLKRHVSGNSSLSNYLRKCIYDTFNNIQVHVIEGDRKREDEFIQQYKPLFNKTIRNDEV